MEYTISDKKWWQNEVPEDEKEKEWAHNIKRGQNKGQKQEPQDAEIECQCSATIDTMKKDTKNKDTRKKEEDYWSTTEETDGEAMRRRMIEACRLRARRNKKMSICTKAVIVFAAIAIIGIVMAIVHALATDGEMSNKTGNYIGPSR